MPRLTRRRDLKAAIRTQPGQPHCIEPLQAGQILGFRWPAIPANQNKSVQR